MAKGKYTVNEVEERTQVPANTLRQWERRYGFPKPERSDSGYRLYSDEDVHGIRTMQRHIADGIPASRAAELVKQLKPLPEGARSLKDMRQELVSALIKLDDAKADEILSEAHALHPVDTVMLELMQKTMVDMGTLWHEHKINTTTEHFASHYIQGRLRSLLSVTANVKSAPSVVIACAPLEQHELGVLILAVMLKRAGYRVYYIGANTPVTDLRDIAKEIQPIGMLVSASTIDSVQILMEHRNILQGAAPILAFGGRAFNEQPELARALGGIYLAKDATDAVDRFHELVQEQGAMRA